MPPAADFVPAALAAGLAVDVFLVFAEGFAAAALVALLLFCFC